jgi:flagellin-specific chaperone FliS
MEELDSTLSTSYDFKTWSYGLGCWPKTEGKELYSSSTWPFKLYLLPVGSEDPSEETCQIEAHCEGKMSKAAMHAVCDHLESELPFFVSLVCSLGPTPGKSNVAWTSENDFLFSPEAKNLFAELTGWEVNAASASENKRDGKLESRIDNAVALMKAAQNQSRASINAALHFAAIESLVGNSIQGINEELGTHLSALLQPRREERDDTTEAIKKLYSYRCKTLHGEPVEEDAKKCGDIQRLTAAVLSAVIEWRRHRELMEHESTRKELVDELRRSFRNGCQVVGVPPWYERFLPREWEFE